MDLGRVGIWTNQLNSLTAGEFGDTVQEVEGLGFGALWCGESNPGREAFTNAALALATTDRLVVATGVASIWARDAATAASAQRMLCGAFPDRFLLGLGVSHQNLVSARGHDYGRPLQAMRDFLQGLDDQPDGVMPPLPGTPPRVLAALGPAMLQLARDRAQGAHPFLVTPEQTKMARDVLGAERLLAPEQGVLLEADPSRARAALREDMGARLRLPNYRKSLVRAGWAEEDLMDGGSDALIDATYAWGSDEAVVARVGGALRRRCRPRRALRSG